MQDYDLQTDSARADLCRLLAACHYQPGPEFAEEKVFDSMRAAAVRIQPDLAASVRRLSQAFATDGLDNLLVDYTRLFLGPVQTLAPPYGSVWLSKEKALMQDSTLAVLELYREGGFDLDQQFRELPDHIAAELEFLYLLIFKEAQARLTGEPGAAGAAAALRKRLLNEHIGCWIGPFTAAVRAGAQSAFYRELAEFTERFVRMEAAANESR